MSQLQRSQRYGVGKNIGGAIYIHRTYERVISTSHLTKAKSALPTDYEYTVVKWVLRSNNISFIKCQHFDQLHEPPIDEVVVVTPEGVTRRSRFRNNPPIYHHKWMFVRDDYGGFDVEESKRRSALWSQLAGIDRKRIGRRDYWVNEVLPRIEALQRRS